MPTEQPTPRPRSFRARRVLAVAAGIAMVPALYAAASAATEGSSTPKTVGVAAHDAGTTETEVEHGVTITKAHGGAPTPSVPETTAAPTGPSAISLAGEVEHGPEAEPGDDNGVDAGDDDSTSAPAPALPVTQTFTSAGGSIDVTLVDGAVSLTSSNPAAGFTTEVHDNGPERVEIRFQSGGVEWRIRVEVAGGALVSEVSQHD